jgi:hypothetical protein
MSARPRLAVVVVAFGSILRITGYSGPTTV